MWRRGWLVLLGGAALTVACLSVGALGAVGVWYLSRGEATPTPTVIAQRSELPSGWRQVSAGNRVAFLAPEQGDLPFQPGFFWQSEPLPQPLNPLQYAVVVYLRVQQQSEQFYAYHAQWVSFNGWPAVELAYAAVQNGQPYEAILWILTDGWTGYLISFVTPYGTLPQYAPQLPEVVNSASSWVAPEPGPLAGGEVPDVWTGSVDSGSSVGGMPAAWDWGDITTAPPLSGFEDPFAGAGWDSGGYGFSGDLYGDLSSSGLYDPEHDAFNTWMAEEWSQALSGENPDPTWQDDAGNLYWEGPSGTLHEWSADYDPSIP
jgi:hypothetical protein